MKSLSIMAVAAVALLTVATSPAEARRHHHHQAQALSQVLECNNDGRCIQRASSTLGVMRVISDKGGGRRYRVARAAHPKVSAARASVGGFGLVGAARSHLGQTASDLGLRRRLWCAAFVNMLTGGGTGSDLARSYARFGSPAPGPAPGVIAVRPHHVEIVTEVVGPGRYVSISGNAGHRVSEFERSTRGVIAWRYPS